MHQLTHANDCVNVRKCHGAHRRISGDDHLVGEEKRREEKR